MKMTAGQAEMYVAGLRWPDGTRCLGCGSSDVGRIESRALYQCRACRRQFSVRLGTVFENSALGLDKWLLAIELLESENISSHRLAKVLGITQKASWRMIKRLESTSDWLAPIYGPHSR